MSDPLSEDAYHALLERETRFAELEETLGWQTLVTEVQKTVEADRRRLLGGDVKDHDEYLKVAWRIRGAESVLTFPEATRELVREYRRQLAEIQGGGEKA